ncbi:hypothetical protein [Burkholderia ubonensis]|uniref:hypothetical protein n=1 Tax=Burkholderia ubonensis TaxID=101571 RepID=UPI001E2F2D16|nr:hypothetical protein [Burkholderia ubonensis]
MQLRIYRLRVCRKAFQVIEVFAHHVSLGVFASGKPDLCAVRLIHIVRCARPAHLCRNPTRLQSVGANIWSTPCNGKGQHGIVALAFGIGFRSVPATLSPKNVVQICVRMVMHARTQIDESLRTLDQCRQDVRRQRAYREDMWGKPSAVSR